MADPRKRRKYPWNQSDFCEALPHEQAILGVLSDEPQTESQIAASAGVKASYAEYNLKYLCGRMLARRICPPMGPDKFVITERGIAWRDRLQKKQQQK